MRTSDNWDWIAKAAELRNAGRVFALVTLIGQKGSAPRGPGAKLVALEDGSFFGSVGGGQLEKLVIEDARQALEQAVSAPRRYPLCLKAQQCCGGSVEAFIEIVGLQAQLFLFGAGHVGQSLCQVLVGTPFEVHAIDSRPEWLHHPDLPKSVRRHPEPWEQFVASARWHPELTYVAVMTHLHDLDREIVRYALTREARFLGLIGSRHKWASFVRQLTTEGVPSEQLARVQCPIGDTTLGKAPREVAISIASELLRQCR